MDPANIEHTLVSAAWSAGLLPTLIFIAVRLGRRRQRIKRDRRQQQSVLEASRRWQIKQEADARDRVIEARRQYEKSLGEFRWTADMSPTAFENHCADYLRLKGWKAETTKGSGDQGVDVSAEKSGLRIVLQCKKYNRPVGNKAVQEAHAGKAFADAHAAAVVSNVGYTPSAESLAKTTGVHLLHFTDLARADSIFGLLPTKGGDDPAPDGRSLGRVACSCPNCHVVLRLPAGRTGVVRCPRCGNRFPAKTGGPPKSEFRYR